MGANNRLVAVPNLPVVRYVCGQARLGGDRAGRNGILPLSAGASPEYPTGSLHTDCTGQHGCADNDYAQTVAGSGGPRSAAYLPQHPGICSPVGALRSLARP